MHSYFLSFIFCVITLIQVSAQSLSLSTVAKKMERYYAANANDKINLILDKERYQHADTVWFYAQLHELFSGRPGSLNKVMHVELWSGETDVKVQEKRFKIVNGQSRGYLVLLGDETPQAYLLRAYTQSMAGLPEAVFSTRWLYVNANPLEASGPAKIDIKFEGGVLAAGLVNKGVIKARSDAFYYLLDSQNDTTAIMQTDLSGIAGFVLKPSPGVKYRIVGPENETVTIPAANEEGVRLMVTPTASHFKINLQANAGYNQSKAMRILVEANGLAYFLLDANLNEGFFLTELPRKSLPYGIARITVFSEADEPLLTRLIFNDSETDKDFLTPDEKVYARRAQVKLHIDDDLQPQLNGVIRVRSNAMVLAGEGQLSHPDFDVLENVEQNHINEGNVDLQMIRASLPKFYSWENILSAEAPRWGREPEGLLTYIGRALQSNGEPLAHQKLDALLLGNDETYETKTNADGSFELVVFDFIGDDFILFADEQGELDAVEWLPIVSDPEAIEKSVQALGNNAALKKRSMIEEVYTYYTSQGSKQVAKAPFPLDKETLDDYTVQLSDFVAFDRMGEVFAEIVNGVQVRNRGEQQTIRVFMPNQQAYASQSPLFVLNGMPVDDADYILGLDPISIESITLLRSQNVVRKYRSIAKNGIILINKIEKNVPVTPTARVKAIAGLSKARLPHFPEFNQPQQHKRIPFLNPTLYFQAVDQSINPSGDFEFFTGDLIGDFQVEFLGFDSEGKYYSTKRYFEVVAEQP